MAIPSIALIPSGYKANKVYSVLPTDGAGDLATTRASSATRVNKEGLLETVATGVPRLDYSDGGCPSLLLEPQSTNLIVNSELNNVENIVVSAVAHTISFYGTGSITLSGVHSATLSGTGANDRVSLTFTPSAGTLICTDSGNVDNKQVEAQPYATSYIPTAGAISTRLADTASKTGLGSYINSSEGVLYAEISALADGGVTRAISIFSAANNRITLSLHSTTNRVQFFIAMNGYINTVDLDATDIVQTDTNKIACKFKANDYALWINGIEKDTNTTQSNTVQSGTLNSLNLDINGSNNLYGNIKDLRVYNTALTDAELTTLTTL